MDNSELHFTSTHSQKGILTQANTLNIFLMGHNKSVFTACQDSHADENEIKAAYFTLERGSNPQTFRRRL